MTAQRFHSKNTSIWYGSNEYHLKIALYQIKVVAKSWLNCMKIKARHEKYERSCCKCSYSLCCVSLEISFDVGMFHRNWPYGLSRKFIGAWVFRIIFIYLRLIIWRKFLEIPKCWNVDDPPFPPHLLFTRWWLMLCDHTQAPSPPSWPQHVRGCALPSTHPCVEPTTSPIVRYLCHIK